MTDERTRRVGRNEGLYRQVNEQIEGLNDVFSGMTGAFSIYCECGRLDCTERIELPVAVYERARADPLLFIVKQDHDERGLERVVETAGDYALIEKVPAEARRIAEETDPRT